jgi:hypothetical protein
MRGFVAGLYVVGALVTMAGVALAYRRARKDLRRLEAVGALHESHDDPDLVEDYADITAGEDARVAARKAQRAAEQSTLQDALDGVGITGGPVRYKDMRLPMEYWAKRSALRDAVASFKSGGLVAIVGVVMSTVASVWSLYLPSGG